jgi:hypothetical protein
MLEPNFSAEASVETFLSSSHAVRARLTLMHLLELCRDRDRPTTTTTTATSATSSNMCAPSVTFFADPLVLEQTLVVVALALRRRPHHVTLQGTPLEEKRERAQPSASSDPHYPQNSYIPSAAFDLPLPANPSTYVNNSCTTTPLPPVRALLAGLCSLPPGLAATYLTRIVTACPTAAWRAHIARALSQVASWILARPGALTKVHALSDTFFALAALDPHVAESVRDALGHLAPHALLLRVAHGDAWPARWLARVVCGVSLLCTPHANAVLLASTCRALGRAGVRFPPTHSLPLFYNQSMSAAVSNAGAFSASSSGFYANVNTISSGPLSSNAVGSSTFNAAFNNDDTAAVVPVSWTPTPTHYGWLTTSPLSAGPDDERSHF